MEIRELVTWKELTNGKSFAWLDTSVGIEDLEQNGICFLVDNHIRTQLIKYYKYGRNVFKVTF